MLKKVNLNVPGYADIIPKGKAFRKVAVTKLPMVKINPRLPVFTVVWVNNAGVPFNTTGFFAIAFTVTGQRISTANFDSFGVAQFLNIATPTPIPLVVRTFNRFGVLFRTRRVPARVEAFAIIG